MLIYDWPLRPESYTQLPWEMNLRLTHNCGRSHNRTVLAFNLGRENDYPDRPQPMSRLAGSVLVLGVLLVSLAVLNPNEAIAQSDEAFDPLFIKVAGPFDIAMSWVPPSPQVGFVNIAVKPELSGVGEAVTDARILIVAEREPGDPEFEVVAVNTPVSPTIYRANLKFEEAGNWVLHVQVNSPTSGQADFRSPLVILPAPIQPDAVGGWVFLGVFIVLAAGGFYVVMTIRKAQAARRMRLQGRL